MVFLSTALALLASCSGALGWSGPIQGNPTYFNPVLPGWHSDPSCIHVNGTFYCATSTFTAFPGLPIYASKDLINWKQINNVWNRREQLPNINQKTHDQQYGFFAPNLRYHAGEFFMTSVYAQDRIDGLLGTIFRTKDILGEWSVPVTWDATPGLAIDPDLFWDDDGTVYLTSAGILQQTIDIDTGVVSEPRSLWNGTGGSSPEGPHIYKKDGWYWLLIAEGGTQLGHRVTIARSRNVTGPYETTGANNPLITAANTTNYFQTVGHADLFQDNAGNWWGMALSTRSGPEFVNFPMGREGVLFPVSWPANEWPIASPVEGIMSGPLPPSNTDVEGNGSFVSASDVVDLAPGSSLPLHFEFWRYPANGSLAVSPPHHPYSLQIVPSVANLTGVQGGNDSLSGVNGISFVGRRQSHTFFEFSVDLDFTPRSAGLEAGITVFYTQLQHIDLGITMANDTGHHGPSWQFILRTTNQTSISSYATIPAAWPWHEASTVSLQIQSANDTTYRFSAYPSSDPSAMIILGYVSTKVVTAEVTNSGSGTLLGVYATSSGGISNHSAQGAAGENAYFSRWRYTGLAQEIAASEYIPSL